MGKRGYKRDLKLDLLAAQRGRGGQGRNLAESTRDLLYGFDQRRALHRPLPRLAPQVHRLLDLPSFSAVTREQLRLTFGDIGELTFEGFGDPGMERASRLAQQRAIGCVPYQSVFEQISRVWWRTLPEQQPCRH